MRTRSRKNSHHDRGDGGENRARVRRDGGGAREEAQDRDQRRESAALEGSAGARPRAIAPRAAIVQPREQRLTTLFLNLARITGRVRRAFEGRPRRRRRRDQGAPEEPRPQRTSEEQRPGSRPRPSVSTPNLGRATAYSFFERRRLTRSSRSSRRKFACTPRCASATCCGSSPPRSRFRTTRRSRCAPHSSTPPSRPDASLARIRAPGAPRRRR